MKTVAVLPLKHQAHFFPAHNKTIGLRTFGIMNGPFFKNNTQLHNVHCYLVAHKALHLSLELFVQKLHN